MLVNIKLLNVVLDKDTVVVHVILSHNRQKVFG
jgi:hypothetical protein